jgi:hypothetical protein
MRPIDETAVIMHLRQEPRQSALATQHAAFVPYILLFLYIIIEKFILRTEQDEAFSGGSTVRTFRLAPPETAKTAIER